MDWLGRGIIVIATILFLKIFGLAFNRMPPLTLVLLYQQQVEVGLSPSPAPLNRNTDLYLMDAAQPDNMHGDYSEGKQEK